MSETAATVGVLFADEYVGMVKLAHLMTGSNEAAEEIVQEAFVKVMHRWDSVRDPGAYLRTAVVNGARSWHRRRATERRHAPAPSGAETNLDGPDEMADALAGLSPRQRTAVVLRFYADMSEAQIAEALGCRKGTVKSLLHRGLASLREAMA